MIRSVWVSSDMAVHSEAEVVSCCERPCRLAALMNLAENKQVKKPYNLKEEHQIVQNKAHLDTSTFVFSSEFLTSTCVWLRA